MDVYVWFTFIKVESFSVLTLNLMYKPGLWYMEENLDNRILNLNFIALDFFSVNFKHWKSKSDIEF